MHPALNGLHMACHVSTSPCGLQRTSGRTCSCCGWARGTRPRYDTEPSKRSSCTYQYRRRSVPCSPSTEHRQGSIHAWPLLTSQCHTVLVVRAGAAHGPQQPHGAEAAGGVQPAGHPARDHLVGRGAHPHLEDTQGLGPARQGRSLEAITISMLQPLAYVPATRFSEQLTGTATGLASAHKPVLAEIVVSAPVRPCPGAGGERRGLRSDPGGGQRGRGAGHEAHRPAHEAALQVRR